MAKIKEAKLLHLRKLYVQNSMFENLNGTFYNYIKYQGFFFCFPFPLILIISDLILCFAPNTYEV